MRSNWRKNMINKKISAISEKQSVTALCDTLSDMISLMTYSECANVPMTITTEYISAVTSAINIIKEINETEEK